jgi:hypothetical protein
MAKKANKFPFGKLIIATTLIFAGFCIGALTVSPDLRADVFHRVNQSAPVRSVNKKLSEHNLSLKLPVERHGLEKVWRSQDRQSL